MSLICVPQSARHSGKCKEVSDSTIKELAWYSGHMHRKLNRRQMCKKCQKFGQDNTCLRNLERESVMQELNLIKSWNMDKFEWTGRRRSNFR